VSLEEFLRARDREPRAVVVSVTINRPRDARDFRFHKVSRVKPKGISVMSIAAHLPQSGGRISNARIAYGAMGPAPLRMPAIERALEGRSLDANGVAQAVAAATQGLDPPTDAIASAWYRREVAPVHLRRLLLNPV
jgi:CO/xanthine dehydrogenase FAD-binding subunit